MAIVVTVRKKGNQLGFVLPKEVIEQQNIREGDTLFFPGIKKISGRTTKSR